MAESKKRLQGHYCLFCIALTCLCVVVYASSAYGQGGVGSTRGEVAGTGGNRSIKGHIYLPGVDISKLRFRVTLEANESQPMSTSTDVNGDFSFNGLTAGSFSIVIEGVSEYEPARETVYIDRAAGSPVNIIPIYLHLKPSADPLFANVPKPALDLYLKGVEAARKGDVNKAIEKLSAAVVAYQAFAQALSELGIQYLKQGNLDKASEALESALKIRPDDFDARLNYGIALLQKKEFAGADKELRAASALRNEAATPHMYLGTSLLGQKQYAEAQKELEQAISLPGGASLAPAHKYLGGIYWALKDYKRAAIELETYLTLAPKAADAERTRTAINELRAKQNDKP